MSAANDESSSDQGQPAIDAIEAGMKQLKPDPNPDLSAEERRQQTSARITELIRQSVEQVGGYEQEELPPGVVRLYPHPLDGIDREADDRFCAELARTLPDDHTCALNRMVQSGEIPPGDYTQDQIDALFGGSK